MIDNTTKGVYTATLLEGIQASITNKCPMKLFYGDGIVLEVSDQDETSPNYGTQYFYGVLEDFAEPEPDKVFVINGADFLKHMSGHSDPRLMIWVECDELLIMANGDDKIIAKHSH